MCCSGRAHRASCQPRRPKQQGQLGVCPLPPQVCAVLHLPPHLRRRRGPRGQGSGFRVSTAWLCFCGTWLSWCGALVVLRAWSERPRRWTLSERGLRKLGCVCLVLAAVMLACVGEQAEALPRPALEAGHIRHTPCRHAPPCPLQAWQESEQRPVAQAAAVEAHRQPGAPVCAVGRGAAGCWVWGGGFVEPNAGA